MARYDSRNKFAIDIKPATVALTESTPLPQAMTASLHLEARSKLYDAFIICRATQFRAIDFQTQPALFRIEPNIRWTGVRIPGFKQVTTITGGVSREA